MNGRALRHSTILHHSIDSWGRLNTTGTLSPGIVILWLRRHIIQASLHLFYKHCLVGSWCFPVELYAAWWCLSSWTPFALTTCPNQPALLFLPISNSVAYLPMCCATQLCVSTLGVDLYTILPTTFIFRLLVFALDCCPSSIIRSIYQVIRISYTIHSHTGNCPTCSFSSSQ